MASSASKGYASSAIGGSRASEGILDRETLDTWCERSILGLVLGLIAWASLATGAVRAQDFVVVQWLTVLILGVWAVRFAINPKHRLLWPWVCWPVLAFMGYAVFRYANADVEYVARQETIRVLVYGFLFFAILHNLHRQETTQWTAFTLIGLGAVVGMYAVGQFVTESDSVWHFVRPEIFRQRGSGTFINPNNLAAFLGMILPLGLAYTLTGRHNYIGKIVLGYASLVIFAGLVVSFSRWGWIAAGVSTVCLLGVLMRNRDYQLQTLLTAGAFAVIIVMVVVVAPRAKGDGRLAYAAKNEDVRFKVWAPATAMWQDHLWLGVGPGHFDLRFRQYRPADQGLQVRPERVHNDYLNVLTDWGTVGGLIILSAMVLFFMDVARSWKHVKRAPNDISTRRSNKSAFMLGGVLGTVALMIHSVFDFNLHVPVLAILGVTLAALVAGHFRFATESYWHTVRWWLRIPVALVLLGGMGYVGAQTWQHTREVSALSRAAATSGNAQIEALERAFEVEPKNYQTAYVLGETFRLQSWQGGDDYKEIGAKALNWFDAAMRLNRYDAYSRLRRGMTLHWIGRHEEAEPFFKEALELDRNGYYTLAHYGWHLAQLNEWEKAREWFEKSLALNSKNNPIATAYLKIAESKLSGEGAPQADAGER